MRDHLNPQSLKEYGLQKSWGEATSQPAWGMPTLKGPNEGQGMVICYGPHDKAIYPKGFSYDPATQSWQQVSDRVWVGWSTGAAPDEAGLRRRETFGSWTLKLGEEHWQIPVLRRLDGTSELPRAIKLNPYREEVKNAYMALWERSEAMWNWATLGELEKHQEEGVTFAVDVLGLNYRYGPLEQNAIGLLDTTNWQLVVCMACDLKSLEDFAAAKKKMGIQLPDLPSLAPGVAA